ncbi:MAG: hydroxymethylglutaryl-CoA lyase [Rhodobacteraceae bacterium]|nr:hydroxymethylglutaryl-CoA lyase [Paracoccaceae bacterium]
MPQPSFPARVEITEVGPRDGLQNEPDWIPTERKVSLIEGLIGAGLRHLEITSFVSPRAVPQMRDAAEIVAALLRHAPEVELTALVPNPAGAERAAAAGVGAMVVFMSASESHNLKNVNRSREASLEGFRAIAEVAGRAGIPVHGAIATSFGCPFEGAVPAGEVVRIARAYRDMGIRRISLGDTTGMATPPVVAALCRALRAELPEVDLALHFHNTRGLGLVCVQAGLAEGVRRYESSVGGLGGCPFVPNATGNIATEDLVYLLEEQGIETKIDLARLIAVAAEAEAIVGRPLPGQVMKAGPRLRRHPLDAARTAHG